MLVGTLVTRTYRHVISSSQSVWKSAHEVLRGCHWWRIPAFKPWGPSSSPEWCRFSIELFIYWYVFHLILLLITNKKNGAIYWGLEVLDTLLERQGNFHWLMFSKILIAIWSTSFVQWPCAWKGPNTKSPPNLAHLPKLGPYSRWELRMKCSQALGHRGP